MANMTSAEKRRLGLQPKVVKRYRRWFIIYNYEFHGPFPSWKDAFNVAFYNEPFEGVWLEK